MATVTFSETIVFKIITCANCAVPFSVTEDFQDDLRRTKKTFYCPNGHSQSYTGEPFNKDGYESKLRQKENELAQLTSAKIQLENQLNKSNNQLTKSNRDLKRLKNGVCPCCNRSFLNLQQHIKKQHPEIVK